MNKLDVNQLRKICKENDYIAVRWGLDVIGINCKVAFLKHMALKPNVTTMIESYRSISFMEYISIKRPFFS